MHANADVNFHFFFFTVSLTMEDSFQRSNSNISLRLVATLELGKSYTFEFIIFFIKKKNGKKRVEERATDAK